MADTDSARRVIIVDPGISLGQPILLLTPSVRKHLELVIPPFLHLSEETIIRRPFFAPVLEKKVDLLLPLRPRMKKESGLRSLQTVLGTVQLAGVAYLAYRHIKKYGFLGK